MIYVLDACAMIAYLRNEPGSTAVLKALIEAGSQSLAHALNLCEVFYDFHRKSDENIATEAINDLYSGWCGRTCRSGRRLLEGRGQIEGSGKDLAGRLLRSRSHEACWRYVTNFRSS